MTLTKEQANQLINNAAQEACEAEVEPEIVPIARYLQGQNHQYGRDFCFCFCVAIEVGHIEARAQGYRDQWDRAGKKMQEARRARGGE